MPTLATNVQHNTRSPNQSIIQTGKEEAYYLCSQMTCSYMLITLKIPHTHTKLKLIKGFSKVSGYKINIKKSVVFLYTNNEKFEKETRKIISFTIVSKRIKYLGKNLTKDVKDLYTENNKILLKEIKEDINK